MLRLLLMAHTAFVPVSQETAATHAAAPDPPPQEERINGKPEPIDQKNWIAPSVIEARACRGERCFVGFVGYTLLVNAEGRATDCAVTRTSGDRALDVETCALLLRGARFKPATNGKGQPIKGRYASAVTWTGRHGTLPNAPADAGPD
ncbi:MAG: energy transducer TonB [Erythrobacter sp.]|uniref:energy transducer TonB n=1 Tax=Erythrobacter sp. TaxID=1042 RepID=UPI002618A9E2|nr:energy transducer TonB [Erythrobacter sp.]MDJ0979313.1 energy transducer TonB [Erythrobacter sp.]